MATEIERRFLVDQDKLPSVWTTHTRIEQFYLSLEPVVRVRLVENWLLNLHHDPRAFLTIKGPGMVERLECEWGISVQDAMELSKLSKARILKMRLGTEFGGYSWVVDSFCGALAGLYLAEIELERVDSKFDLPPWVLAEVTNDPRYSNVSLAVKGLP